MNDHEKLIAEARRLTVIDRISSEPVVAMLGRVADALEAAGTKLICPQPCAHLSQEDSREGRTCSEHPCTCREPQGEPSDAMVEAGAREAFFTDDAGGHIRGGHTWDTIPEVGRENYRTMVRGVLHAALRAAGGVR